MKTIDKVSNENIKVNNKFLFKSKKLRNLINLFKFQKYNFLISKAKVIFI